MNGCRSGPYFMEVVGEGAANGRVGKVVPNFGKECAIAVEGCDVFKYLG